MLARLQTSEIRQIIRDAGSIIAATIVIFIRILLFPFQLVIFAADFVLAGFTLAVVGLILGLWLGLVSPSTVIDASSNFIERNTARVMAAADHYAKTHPQSAIGRALNGPPEDTTPGNAAEGQPPTATPTTTYYSIAPTQAPVPGTSSAPITPP